MFARPAVFFILHFKKIQLKAGIASLSLSLYIFNRRVYNIKNAKIN